MTNIQQLWENSSGIICVCLVKNNPSSSSAYGWYWRKVE